MPTVSEFWDGRAQNYDAQVGNHYAEPYQNFLAEMCSVIVHLHLNRQLYTRRLPHPK